MADKPKDGKKMPSWKERLKKAYDKTSDNAKILYKEAKKKAEVIYEDAKKNTDETLETLSVLTENGKKKEPSPITLKERLNAAAKRVKETDWKAVGDRVKKTDWNAVVKDTAQEITKKDEIKKLAGSIIILPGGLAVYGAYRVAKHHKEQQELEKQGKLKPKAASNINIDHPKAEEPKVEAPTRRKRPPRPPRSPSV